MGQNYPDNMVQKITDLTKLVVNEFPFSKDLILSSWTDEDSKKIAEDITNRYCITGIGSFNFQNTAISLIRQTMSLIANAYQQNSSILSSVATIRQSIEQEIQTELTRITRTRTPYIFQLLSAINANREVVLKELDQKETGSDRVYHDYSTAVVWDPEWWSLWNFTYRHLSIPK